MILNEEKVTVGDNMFLLRPLSPFDAIVLDQKVMLLLLPLLNGLKDFKNIDTKIDIQAMVEGITLSFSKTSKPDMQNLIVELFKGVAFMPAGGTDIELNAGTINEVFAGCFTDIYLLIFEVMRYNKFLPFRMVAGGQFQGILRGLKSMKKGVKKKKEKSEKSAN